MPSTPLMKQYAQVKAEHQDCLLLYRMGDFYELFYDDAVIASRVLGLTLTSRNQAHEDNTPLAGFPYHSIEKHMPKLVNAGYKVAICEQVEDPATAKGLVKREVIEVITRGTTTNDNCLDAKTNNYLAALFPGQNLCGLSYIDLSTGLYTIMEGSVQEAIDEIYRLNANEVLFPEETPVPEALEEIKQQDKILITSLEKGRFNFGEALRNLTRQFNVLSLDSFDCGRMKEGVAAAGAILSYVKEHKKNSLGHLTKLTTRKFTCQMNLDAATIRNLELIRPIHSDDETGTLFHLLDKTVTAMGGRKLKYWLSHPLLDIEEIRERQNAIGELIENSGTLKSVKTYMREINDIERIVAKIGSKRANARDLLGLGHSLLRAANVGISIGELTAPLFGNASRQLTGLSELGEELIKQFVENPPFTVREGNMLNPEVHPQLKQILDDSRQGKAWLSNLEKTVKMETGIPTLKVGYNKVFGYYIEVTKQHTEKIPDDFIRKQTLVNAERYITPEMKEWENRILNSEGKANSIEYELFCGIRDKAGEKAAILLEAGHTIAKIDVLCSMALIAKERNYCKPIITNNQRINITEGRHPVVESITDAGSYIGNDADLDTDKRQILLMTGPNMSGKSTYLRQVGLIVLMAQTGFYVPAQKAEIGLVDRIFTRVGASDRLARGQSTFMVEMIETASILHNATSRSLILLDEIGRGTSTFDGLSLAWAIVEALHQNQNIAARTLFATHYHELTALPKKLQRVVNIQVAVKEVEQRVIFLHKVLEGHCDSSYGIQVAGMAGLPRPVIDRAWEVLESLEKERSLPNPALGISKMKSRETPGIQGDLFSAPAPVNPVHKLLHDEVLHMKLDNLTPLEVMNKVNALQRKYGND
ncbi:MAG: DNA mismatch repair protein MutS [Fibrobacteria bacterium]|nr:DNA mismatch repair protein MutS [Fibrobacteria bacterium]